MTWNSAAVASQRMWRISSPTARMWWGFQKIDITKWKLACASLWNCLLKCVAAAPSSNTINASHSLWLRYDLRPLFVWQDYTTLLHNSWVWHWGCLCLTSLLVICFRWVFLLPVFNIIWALIYLVLCSSLLPFLSSHFDSAPFPPPPPPWSRLPLNGSLCPC